MIVRIMGEGQVEVGNEQLEGLNALDAEVEAAVSSGDTEAFSLAFGALLDAVRRSGKPLPDEVLHDSDLVLPPADASIEEVRELLGVDGLVPD
jgi:hypothetical protein